MAKGRSSKPKEKPGNKVTPITLPETHQVPIPEALRWKAKAFQSSAEKAGMAVKQAQTEFLLRQAELKEAQRELQAVVEEVKEAIEDDIPEGYSLEELNPTEGFAICHRKME